MPIPGLACDKLACREATEQQEDVMSETATTPVTEVKAETPKLTFAQYLEKTGLPEMALKPITDKVAEHNSLVAQVNKWIAQVNAAKAADPSNAEYLDTLWRANETDESLAETVAEFDAVAEQYETLLKKLREGAKNFVPKTLSEEENKATRVKVNNSTPTLAETRKAIGAQLSIPESMLGMLGVAIPEGGLVSLLPTADSLKNARGRKAATASGNVASYMTRVGDVLIDGKSTQINGKGKFDYAAEKLSVQFGRGVNPANAVTGEELEEAMFEALQIPFRSVKGKELADEFSFTFTKTVKKQNPNDDGFTDVPMTVKLTVISERANKAEDEKPETATETKVDEVKNDTPAEVPAQIETKAPAKKTAAPTKKQ